MLAAIEKQDPPSWPTLFLLWESTTWGKKTAHDLAETFGTFEALKRRILRAW